MKNVYKPRKIQPNTTTSRVNAVLQDGEPHAISELEELAGPRYYDGVARLLKRTVKAHRHNQHKGRSALVLRADTIQLTLAPPVPKPANGRGK